MECDKIESDYVLARFKMSKRKRCKKRLFLILLIIFLIAFLIFLYFNKIANPLIIAYGEAQVNKLLVEASNSAISKINTFSYENLIHINYDSDNTISSIIADGQKINSIANSLAFDTQNQINDLSSIGIYIPIGTLSGISFLIGKGSNINLSVNPIGSVKCDFYTSFSSAGINQTLHKIYVVIESQASLILPFQTQKIKNSTKYLVSECVIIGKVPSTYLNITSLKDLYK